MSLQGVDYEARCMRLEAEVERLRAAVRLLERVTDPRIEAALALHQEVPMYQEGNQTPGCAVCYKAWPCPTVKALSKERD